MVYNSGKKTGKSSLKNGNMQKIRESKAFGAVALFYINFFPIPQFGGISFVLDEFLSTSTLYVHSFLFHLYNKILQTALDTNFRQ